MVLAMSTMEYPEVCEYPDSDKHMVRTGLAPDDFHAIGRSAESLDYWMAKFEQSQQQDVR